MTRDQAWDISNVDYYRGFDVTNGEVTLTEEEFADILDEEHGSVMVCGMELYSGQILKECDPVAFRTMKSDYESQLDSELEDQLRKEDDSDIEFGTHPDDCEEEEEPEEESDEDEEEADE